MFTIHNLGNTCMKMELFSSTGKFLKPSLRSGKYRIQEDAFNGKPLYYSNESSRYLFSSTLGFWAVRLRHNLRSSVKL